MRHVSNCVAFKRKQYKMLKESRIRDKKHLKFIASLPCCVSGHTDVQAAHIRNGCLSCGMKPSDSKTVPLYWKEHLKQHETSEKKYWESFGGVEKALLLASFLYENTGNKEACLSYINKFKSQTL